MLLFEMLGNISEEVPGTGEGHRSRNIHGVSKSEAMDTGEITNSGGMWRTLTFMLVLNACGVLSEFLTI